MDEREQKLEQWIRGALAGLPPRRAPQDLERRVLEEIARRAALPWWRRGFGEWPIVARTGFVVLCVLLVAGLSLTGGFAREVGLLTWDWAHPLIGLFATLGGTATLLAGVVPMQWVYAALTVGALFYVLLFGLGAFAYRTLYLHSHTAMIRS